MNGPIPKRKVLSRTTEAFQDTILSKEKMKVKVDILLQHACDIKLWLGSFSKPLVSNLLQIWNLLTHMSGEWRKTF